MEQSEVIVIKVLSPCDIHKISMILLRNKFQMFNFFENMLITSNTTQI